MKQCPNCKTTYSDDTLSFCLVDGAGLINLRSADKTIEMSGETANPMRVNIASKTAPTFVSPEKIPAQTARQGMNPYLVFPLLAILFLSVIGLVGYILLKPADDITANRSTPTPAATTTPNSETAALKDELESLKKQIESQQPTTKNDSSVRPVSPDTPSAPVIQTARANSPNDGFLALRSIPDSENGDRLAKIPHGTNLEIIGCQKDSGQLPGKRRGRWCRTNYNGQSGWVFDAFLIY